ncbi:ZBED5 protein, partial [Amia calva]|nr:ZBED5 protein [Amia calva]
IAKAGKPHTIGEQLCLPLAKEMTHIMCGEKAAKQLNLVPLIGAMADDVKNTLIECIKSSRSYSIQLDETTDVADLANLLVYIRYENDGPDPFMTSGTTSLRISSRCKYFPVTAETNNWMRNPLSIETSEWLAGEFNRIALRLNIEICYQKSLVLDFWIQQHSKYPALSDKAVRFLLPFVNTYLCEKGFSSLAVIKTKYRSRMDAEPNLRLKLTSIEPDIAGLCSQRKAHPSH